MCVGITPPCSKCGAPARYKIIISSNKALADRVLDTLEWIHENVDHDCPIRRNIMALLEGKEIKDE